MKLRRYLLKLPLWVKLNLTLYIAVIYFVVMVIAFMLVGKSVIEQIRKDTDFQRFVYLKIDEIEHDVRKLDFLTFDQTVSNKSHEKEIAQIADRVLENFRFFSRQPLFKNDREIEATLEKVHKRLVGYRQLLASLPEDAREDPEDGLYGVYGLSKASMLIFSELGSLRDLLDRTIVQELRELDRKVMAIRVTVMALAVLVFSLMFYLSRSVADTMMWQFDELKKLIVSFFDYLTGKSPEMRTVRFEANDEISEMAEIIDDHLHVAGEIVAKERQEARIIERWIKEATAEIRKLNKEIEATQREILFTMGAVAEERSNETGAHVRRVAEYSYILAKLSGMGHEEAILLKSASPMHDIGKIGIPVDSAQVGQTDR